jgi:hypothetical protein
MNINIVGQREEGKTTLALYLARQHNPAVIVFDPRGNIEGAVVWGPDEMEQAIQERVYEDEPIVYRYDSEDPDEEFSDFCMVLFPPRFPRGGFSVVIDECNMLQNANSIHPALRRAIKQHPTKPPERSVAIIQTTHVLGEFNSKSRSLMNELYMFRIQGVRDLKVVEEHTGNQQVAEIVKNLPQHHCVRYLYSRQAEGKPEYYVWSDPTVWNNAATDFSGPQKPKIVYKSEAPIRVI